jgi:hypothetical protein
MRDYGGGPSRPPFWRTLKESCKGLGSVSLKINTQHTQAALLAHAGESRKGLIGDLKNKHSTHTGKWNFETRYTRCQSDSNRARDTQVFMTVSGRGITGVCVECLIASGKQKKPILFKVTEPSSVLYGGGSILNAPKTILSAQNFIVSQFLQCAGK